MDKLYISQINLGSNTYDIKDAEARADISSLQSAVAGGTHYIGKTSTAGLVDGYTSGVTVGTGADAVEYIVSGTPTTGQALLTAGDIVIKAAASGSAETALEYIWDGAKWSELGSTGHLKGLAYQDSASASYTPAGSVSVTLSNASVVASATQGSLPSKAADSFTANTPTTIDTTKFSGGSKASDSFTPASLESGFYSAGTAPSLGSATTGTFATEGVTASVSNEVLSFGSASTSSAVTAQGTFSAGTLPTIDTTKFNGGSFTEGAFTPAAIQNGFYSAGSAASFTEGAFDAGSLPTFTTGTVGVDSASFSGTAATITVE